MAVREIDGEVFKRRFQQKLSDHYAEGSKADIEVNSEEKDGESAEKKSPFCIQNFLWLGAAISVVYFSDLINVVLYDLRIRNAWFFIGVLSMGLHVGIAIFLVFWLTICKNVNSDDWEKRYPSAVPLATAALIIGLICLCVGLWSVWGFLTPVILLILVMGTVVIIAMIG